MKKEISEKMKAYKEACKKEREAHSSLISLRAELEMRLSADKGAKIGSLMAKIDEAEWEEYFAHQVVRRLARENA